jgi:hypothetical protein
MRLRQGSISPAAIGGLAPWSTTIRRSGVALREAVQRLEVSRQDQRVEDQAVAHHRACAQIDRGIGNPVVVGQVLEHRPQALELGLRRQRGDAPGRIHRLQVGPADHAPDERVPVGKREHPARVVLGRHGLHEHRAVDACALAQRLEVGRQEVAVDRVQLRGRPLPLPVGQAPEVLVGIDAGQRAHGRGGGAISRGRSSPRASRCCPW